MIPAAGSQENYTTNGLTKVEVIVLATIVSALVGLIGTIILSKRVFASKGDNCFAPCDGTGKDRDYMEDSDNMGQDDGYDNVGSIQSGHIDWIVDKKSNLSVIDEGMEIQSTITNQTNMTPTRALRSNDDISIGSLSTVLASNTYLPVTLDVREVYR